MRAVAVLFNVIHNVAFNLYIHQGDVVLGLTAPVDTCNGAGTRLLDTPVWRSMRSEVQLTEGRTIPQAHNLAAERLLPQVPAPGLRRAP